MNIEETIQRKPSDGDYFEAKKLKESELSEVANYVMEVRQLENKLFTIITSFDSTEKTKAIAIVNEQKAIIETKRLRVQLGQANDKIFELERSLKLEIQKATLLQEPLELNIVLEKLHKTERLLELESKKRALATPAELKGWYMKAVERENRKKIKI
jgi:hypothetical protein